MRRASWNRNIHYHNLVLQAVPPNCGRALDVGCGQGQLARKLAQRCTEVIAIDVDEGALGRATAKERVRYVQGDVMTHDFAESSFDLIVAVATLHHLPLKAALVRFQSLLKPGGSLVVVGLHRVTTLEDYILAMIAIPISWLYRLRYGLAHVGAPICDPDETLNEIRTTCGEMLPGARFSRLLQFRYLLVWKKS
jgi:2-polyprenyl-3-methyl-5-hydroxy-6-metoxy-1,4-benzoquinol methylase